MTWLYKCDLDVIYTYNNIFLWKWVPGELILHGDSILTCLMVIGSDWVNTIEEINYMRLGPSNTWDIDDLTVQM